MPNSRNISRVFTGLFVIAAMCMVQSASAQHHVMQDSIPLKMAGNDVFGTIQEVVQKLEANPNTDWSRVDLEALRQHLLDMKAFTEEVQVLSKKSIDNGVEILVQSQSDRAAGALTRLFSMHPVMLKSEKGWDMAAKQNGRQWTITCTTKEKADVDKIRALGYIGLLTEGAHHQMHHWMVATGSMHMKH